MALTVSKWAIEMNFGVINMGSLVLAPWTFGFDPQKTRMERRHLQVILLGFLFFCWNLQGLMSVVKSIGRFIMVEEEHLMGGNRKETHILVDIDPQGGS